MLVSRSLMSLAIVPCALVLCALVSHVLVSRALVLYALPIVWSPVRTNRTRSKSWNGIKSVMRTRRGASTKCLPCERIAENVERSSGRAISGADQWLPTVRWAAAAPRRETPPPCVRPDADSPTAGRSAPPTTENVSLQPPSTTPLTEGICQNVKMTHAFREDLDPDLRRWRPACRFLVVFLFSYGEVPPREVVYRFCQNAEMGLSRFFPL